MKINDNVNLRLCRLSDFRGLLRLRNLAEGIVEKRLRKRFFGRGSVVIARSEKNITRICVSKRFLLANIMRISSVLRIKRIILGNAE